MWCYYLKKFCRTHYERYRVDTSGNVEQYNVCANSLLEFGQRNKFHVRNSKYKTVKKMLSEKSIEGYELYKTPIESEVEE